MHLGSPRTRNWFFGTPRSGTKDLAETMSVPGSDPSADLGAKRDVEKPPEGKLNLEGNSNVIGASES